MSDEIFEIATHSVDVAALGQDYSDRVDGERILLGLPRALEVGEEVRFVVCLLDGTPAFAGAGRCIQVSDQGDDAGQSRFETLIDSLAFDERSQPVYEYVVAVRQLAYQQGETAESSAEHVADAAAADGDVDVAMPSDAPAEEAAWDPDLTRVSRGSVMAEAARMQNYDLDGSTMEMAKDRVNEVEGSASNRPTPMPEAHITARPVPSADLPEPEEPAALSVPAQAQGAIPPAYATVPPEPLKTGILTRPALAAHWAPAAPRPPQRSLRPTGFQSKPGPLGVPAVPPRPALDRSQWVERAPAPQ
ncbi:MAG TPA: hypothetical protein VFN67_39195 [Polyangiales bacterium]|nr:hypothetical protein [Polyangiales bacterium]